MEILASVNPQMELQEVGDDTNVFSIQILACLAGGLSVSGYWSVLPTH